MRNVVLDARCHPVEGGSANDYDYANGDPVNLFDLDGRDVSGWCVTGAYGWGLTIEGSFCLLTDDHGDTLLTYSLGGGGGAEAGGNGSTYYSNAPHVRDVLGWSTCGGGGVGAGSGEACFFKGRDSNSYYSVNVAIGTGQKYGAHITALYTAKVPSWARRWVMRYLLRNKPDTQ